MSRFKKTASLLIVISFVISAVLVLFSSTASATQINPNITSIVVGSLTTTARTPAPGPFSVNNILKILDALEVPGYTESEIGFTVENTIAWPFENLFKSWDSLSGGITNLFYRELVGQGYTNPRGFWKDSMNSYLSIKVGDIFSVTTRPDSTYDLNTGESAYTVIDTMDLDGWRDTFVDETYNMFLNKIVRSVNFRNKKLADFGSPAKEYNTTAAKDNTFYDFYFGNAVFTLGIWAVWVDGTGWGFFDYYDLTAEFKYTTTTNNILSGTVGEITPEFICWTDHISRGIFKACAIIQIYANYVTLCHEQALLYILKNNILRETPPLYSLISYSALKKMPFMIPEGWENVSNEVAYLKEVNVDTNNKLMERIYDGGVKITKLYFDQLMRDIKAPIENLERNLGKYLASITFDNAFKKSIKTAASWYDNLRNILVSALDNLYEISLTTAKAKREIFMGASGFYNRWGNAGFKKVSTAPCINTLGGVLEDAKNTIDAVNASLDSLKNALDTTYTTTKLTEDYNTLINNVISYSNTLLSRSDATYPTNYKKYTDVLGTYSTVIKSVNDNISAANTAVDTWLTDITNYATTYRSPADRTFSEVKARLDNAQQASIYPEGNGLEGIDDNDVNLYNTLFTYFVGIGESGVAMRPITGNEPTKVPKTDLTRAETRIREAAEIVDRYILSSGGYPDTDSSSYAKQLVDYVKGTGTLPSGLGPDPEKTIADNLLAALILLSDGEILMDDAYETGETMRRTLENIWHGKSEIVDNYITKYHPWKHSDNQTYRNFWAIANSYLENAKRAYATAMSTERLGYRVENMLLALDMLRMADLWARTNGVRKVIYGNDECEGGTGDDAGIYDIAISKLAYVDNLLRTAENITNFSTYAGRSLSLIREEISSVRTSLSNVLNDINAGNLMSAFARLVGVGGTLTNPSDGSIIDILNGVQSVLETGFKNYGDNLTLLYDRVKEKYDLLREVMDKPETLNILVTEGYNFENLNNSYLIPSGNILEEIYSRHNINNLWSWVWPGIKFIENVWKIEENLNTAWSKLCTLARYLRVVFSGDLTVTLKNVSIPSPIIYVNEESYITYDYEVTNLSQWLFDEPGFVSVKLPPLPKEKISKVEYDVQADTATGWITVPDTRDNRFFSGNNELRVKVPINMISGKDGVTIRVTYKTVLVRGPSQVTFKQASENIKPWVSNRFTASATLTVAENIPVEELEGRGIRWKFITSNPTTSVFADNAKFGKLDVYVSGELVNVERKLRNMSDTTVSNIVVEYSQGTSPTKHASLSYLAAPIEERYTDLSGITTDIDNENLAKVNLQIALYNSSVVRYDNVLFEEFIPHSASNISVVGMPNYFIEDMEPAKRISARYSSNAGSRTIVDLSYNIPFSETGYNDLVSIVEMVKTMKKEAVEKAAAETGIQIPASIQQAFDNVDKIVREASTYTLRVMREERGENRVTFTYIFDRENFISACTKLIDALKILKSIGPEALMYAMGRYAALRSRIQSLAAAFGDDANAIRAINIPEFAQALTKLENGRNTANAELATARDLAAANKYDNAVNVLISAGVILANKRSEAIAALSDEWSDIVQKLKDKKEALESRFNRMIYERIPDRIGTTDIIKPSAAAIDFTLLEEEIYALDTVDLSSSIKNAIDSLFYIMSRVDNCLKIVTDSESAMAQSIRAGVSQAYSDIDTRVTRLSKAIYALQNACTPTITDAEVLRYVGTPRPKIPVDDKYLDNEAINALLDQKEQIFSLKNTLLVASDESTISIYIRDKNKLDYEAPLLLLEKGVVEENTRFARRLDKIILAAESSVRELEDNKLRMLGKGWVAQARAAFNAGKYADALYLATAALNLQAPVAVPPEEPPWVVIISIVVVVLVFVVFTVLLIKGKVKMPERAQKEEVNLSSKT